MRISDWSSDVCSSDLTTIEYTDNIRRLVINNTSQLFVPQQWYSYPTTIFGVGSGIDLVEISSPIDCIGDNAGAVLKCPTFVEHEPMDHRHGHEIFEPFQGTHDQRPMRPRASHGNVEVVSVRLRGILPPVPGNHVTKLRFRPDKPSA